jgi:hypothetical protein
MEPDMTKALEAAAAASDIREAITDRLSYWYEQGVVCNGRWNTAGMRDAEELEGFLGLVGPNHDDDEVVAKMAEAVEQECRRITRQVIRAFAENVTDEMAAKISGVVGPELIGPDDTIIDEFWTATKSQLRAAILKGLE